MNDRLPDEPRARTLELVRRSAASSAAPPTNLPPDLDQMVREAERDRAVTYAAMDDLTDRCQTLAEDISSSGIVVDILDEEDDSLVISLDDLADTCKTTAA
jgi:hypothetical protein